MILLLDGLPADVLCALGGSFMTCRSLHHLSCCSQHFRDTFRANAAQVWRLQLIREFTTHALQSSIPIIVRLGTDESASELYQQLAGVREVGRSRGGIFCWTRCRVISYNHESELFGSPAVLIVSLDDPTASPPSWCPASRLRRESPLVSAKLRAVGESVEVLQERTLHHQRCVRHGSIQQLDWIGKMRMVDFEPQSYEEHHVSVLRCLVQYDRPTLLANVAGWDCEAGPVVPLPLAEWIPMASPRLRDAVSLDPRFPQSGAEPLSIK